jgi:flagellar basal body-associated protein FliL
MTLPKGWDSKKSNVSSESPKKNNTAVGIIIFVIILVIIGAIYFIGLSQADEETQRNLNRGCIPMSSDWRGIPTTWSCPVR